MQIPDCLGLEIDNASQLLASWGISYSVEKSQPFYKGAPKESPEGSLRVIGQREQEGKAVLTVCFVPPEGDEHVRN